MISDNKLYSSVEKEKLCKQQARCGHMFGFSTDQSDSK